LLFYLFDRMSEHFEAKKNKKDAGQKDLVEHNDQEVTITGQKEGH